MTDFLELATIIIGILTLISGVTFAVVAFHADFRGAGIASVGLLALTVLLALTTFHVAACRWAIKTGQLIERTSTEFRRLELQQQTTGTVAR